MCKWTKTVNAESAWEEQSQKFSFFKDKDFLEVLECFAAYFMKFLKTSLKGICLGYVFHSGKSLLVYFYKKNVLIKKIN